MAKTVTVTGPELDAFKRSLQGHPRPAWDQLFAACAGETDRIIVNYAWIGCALQYKLDLNCRTFHCVTLHDNERRIQTHMDFDFFYFILCKLGYDVEAPEVNDG